MRKKKIIAMGLAALSASALAAGPARAEAKKGDKVVMFVGESYEVTADEELEEAEPLDGDVVAAIALASDEKKVSLTALKPGETEVYATTKSGKSLEWEVEVKKTQLSFTITDQGEGLAMLEVKNGSGVLYRDIVVSYTLRDSLGAKVEKGELRLPYMPPEQKYRCGIPYGAGNTIDVKECSFYLTKFGREDGEFEACRNDVKATASDLPAPGLAVMEPELTATNHSADKVYAIVSVEFYKAGRLINAMPYYMGEIAPDGDADFDVQGQYLDYVSGYDEIKLATYAWKKAK